MYTADRCLFLYISTINVLWGCLLETSSFSKFSLHEHTCHLADCSQKWCVGSEQPDFRLIWEFQVCLQIIMAKTRLVLLLGYWKEWDVNPWCHHDHTGALCFSGHLPEWHNRYHLPLVNCTFEVVCFWDFAIDSLHCNSGYSWLLMTHGLEHFVGGTHKVWTAPILVIFCSSSAWTDTTSFGSVTCFVEFVSTITLIWFQHFLCEGTFTCDSAQ